MAFTAERKSNNEVPDKGSLRNLIKRLSLIIREKQGARQPGMQGIEWTMKDLVLPLLKGLGWDRGTDIIRQSGSHGNRGGLDLVLTCRTPIGIQVRRLDETPPRNIEHPQIKDGMRQCMMQKIPYFIWTNGDSWQFFSLALAKTSCYRLNISKIDQDLFLLEGLFIIEREAFLSNPERIDSAVTRNAELTALSHAWTSALKNHTRELLEVFRKGLKPVNIKDEVILRFLKTFRPDSVPPRTGSSISFELDGLMTQRRSPLTHKQDNRVTGSAPLRPIRSADLLPKDAPLVSFRREGLFVQGEAPAIAPKARDWNRLIDSYESSYRLARWFFQTSYYRRLGEYLISEDYQPWAKGSTWIHLGFTDGKNGDKKVRHAETLFLEWGFIEEAEGDRYLRVEGSSPYLKRLLENTASPQ